MPGYVGHGPGTEREMLAAIGVSDFRDLLKGVPESAIDTELPDIPAAQSEDELRRLFAAYASRNYDPTKTACFLGAGLYDHIVPAAIRHLTMRSEFYTAYTPYQPEVAQGTLAAIYEFQSIMAELTGMDVANASVYDAATGAAEALFLAQSAVRRNRVLVSDGMHPATLQVLETSLHGRDLVLERIPLTDGVTDLDELKKRIGPDVAAVMVAGPNFYGLIEDVEAICSVAHEAGALAAVSINPVALGLLESPGAQGADIVVGEVQSFGNQPQFGGPLCGLFAAKKELVRRMPGRLVAETMDKGGRRGFVLTLQTREQHIRREKATSNICTNSSLLALGATIYFCLLGPKGLKEVAEQCLRKAHYLQERLCDIPGVRRSHAGPFFHEFALDLPRPAGGVVDSLLAGDRILAGLDLGRLDPSQKNRLLVAVTEKRTREEMDRFVDAMRRVIAQEESGGRSG